MPITVAVTNQKGGVGKTTLTINTAAALAAMGERVLLIDLDPQGHLTEGMGRQDIYDQAKVSLYNCLVDRDPPTLADLVTQAATDPLDIIPATVEMTVVEQQLWGAKNREHKLRLLLSDMQPQYDWIFVDCPPNLGPLTDNALNAAENVLIPVQAEPTSVRALELLTYQIETIEKALRIHINVLAVVPNLVRNTNLAKSVMVDLRDLVPHVTPFHIPMRGMLQDAWGAGCSIFSYRAHSSGDEKARSEICAIYTQLAEYVMERVGRTARREVTVGR
jgi:chromosome partitioning protein